MIEKKTVKSCKNCTITEVWVQVLGMPSEYKNDPTNPYPLFKNLQTALESDGHQLDKCTIKKTDNPVLLNIQTGPHKISISNPFWNGEIIWKENNQKKILRVGHKFFALHALFDQNHPYINYDDSFNKTLCKVINYIDSSNIFDAIQITVRYVNVMTIGVNQEKKFDVGQYFNTNVSYKLNKRLLNTNFNFEFASSDKRNRIIGINTIIRGTAMNKVLNIVQTTGVSPLGQKTKLNDAIVFNEIKSIKEELKDVFFDTMTDTTKNKIMGVQYV
ncbi:MAG: TIGR04255 family protein [Bdellovibrionales bacterium]|nr:TIGR04255 family protein [Bdellovibrionales bacterium]